MSWTPAPSRFLVAVDFGEPSARALRAAAALAGPLNATLDAVHAETLEAPPYFTPDQAESLARQRENARASAERFLVQFAEKQGVALRRPAIADGPAYAAILKLADEADLVVMGTHGRTGPSRWWLGSVAERVVRESPVPVLVVRAASTDEDAATMFRRPLVIAPSSAGLARLRPYAEILAGVTGGAVIESTDGLSEDAGSRAGATMLVLARSRERHWFGDPFAEALRRYELPLLFVPD
jgi:nucleotide-binding universal stress UspA family protein